MRLLTGLLLVWAGVCAAAGARAADAPIARTAPAHGLVAGAGSNDAPRFVRHDDPAEPQRSTPGHRSESVELGYRWWLSRGRADLGLGLGTLAYVTRPSGSLPGLGGDAGATALASGTVLTLGMRYRTSEHSAVFADAAGWRGAGSTGNDAVVGKVGLEFKAAQSRWNIAYGGLGLQLAGDTRMALRLRRGGLAIAMRRSF